MPTRAYFSGNWGSVDLYLDDSGKCDVEEFLLALSTSDLRKVDVVISYLGQNGKVTNKEKFKKITDTPLFEIKSFQIRILCAYRPGRRLVLLHCCTKKRDKLAERDIDRAQSRLVRLNQE